MSDTQAGAIQDLLGSAAGTLDLASKAARDGAADARDAAIRTWNATSEIACRVVYNTCYAVSYGVVFPAVFLAHSVPRNNAVVRGLVERSPGGDSQGRATPEQVG